MPIRRHPPVTPPVGRGARIERDGGLRRPGEVGDKNEKREPDDVYASHRPALVSPAHKLNGTFLGYKFDPKDVDAVMKKHGLGDVKALLRVAIALHRNTSPGRFLTLEQLEKAANQSASKSYANGVRFTASAVADVMKQTGIAEQGALIRAARRLDDGDKRLSRDELDRAGAMLKSIIKAHDVDEVHKRVELARAAGAIVEKIGEAGGDPIEAVTLRSIKQPPSMRVLITGGIHGNEPCGTAAALLLLEQTQHNPKMREEIEFVFIPLINPRGLRQGTRRTPEDVDINRTFEDAHSRDHDPAHDSAHDHAHDGAETPAETKAVKAYVLKQVAQHGAFKASADLHSGKADRNGFWLLHDDSEKAAAFAMKRFGETFPALSEDAAPYTLSAPGVAASKNEGTLKSFAKDAGTKLSFTIEAPGSVAYLDQVLGEAELVLHLIDAARLD